MKTRALCLLVGLSMVAPLAAAPPSQPICPFGFADPQLQFDEVEGPFTLTDMTDIDPDTGSLPCGYAVWIDATGKRPWVAVDVAAVPRHLAVTVDLDKSALLLQPEERVEFLRVSSGSPHAPGDAASVSLTSDQLVLAWRHDGQEEETRRAVPGPRFTLLLVVDRGRDAAGFLTLSVPGVDEPPLRLGPVDLWSIPIAGSPAAKISFGALATSPVDLGVGEPKGPLRFRPIAIESGWGRP
jgi:hypothetical protein